MRQVILDVETTGLYPNKGHKIIEIGCVEVVDKIKTDRTFHFYINPERDVPQEAFNIHGISTDFLRDKPIFKDIAQSFQEFVSDSDLIIHNAQFDMKFINYELTAIGKKPVIENKIIDTLMIARTKFPGSPASLDALCKRFNVSLKERETKGHGALLDSELLYHVYIYLTEGVQSKLIVQDTQKKNANIEACSKKEIPPRKFEYSKDFEDHKKFIEKIENNLW